MPLHRFRFFAFVAAAFFLPNLFATTTYYVTPLTSLPSNAEPQSLNDSLELAGITVGTDFVTYTPFTATTTSFTGGSIPSGLRTVLNVSINDSGAIAGFGVTTSTDVDQAFIGSTLLGFPSGYAGSIGVQYNNAGQLSGYLATTSTFVDHAGIMTATSATELSTANSFFNGINSAATATAVGYDGTVGSRQVIYGTASSVTTVSLAGTGFSEMIGEGINAQRNICGYGADTSSGYQQAFLYNPSTGTTTIIPIPAGFDAATQGPQCISSGNVVVGSANSSGGANVAWIWDATDGTQLLSAVVAPGWTFTQAVAINSLGDILVQGTDGTFTGYELLEPVPEPATVLLSGISLLCLGIHLRRLG